MYENRRLVRDHVIKVRVNDDELDCIIAFARLTRKQKASIAREWMINGMRIFAQSVNRNDDEQFTDSTAA